MEWKIGFDWQAVVHRDFDVDLDEPGRRSGAALEALLADLNVEAEPPLSFGEWADRLRASASAEPTALLERLDHPDVRIRRILAVALAYLDMPDDAVFGIRASVAREPDAPTRLALLLALGRYPQTHDYLRRHLNREPSDALGAALGLLLHKPEAVDDTVLDALAHCDGEAGSALTELAWADPEWAGFPPSGAVETVDDWLHPTPDLRSRWLTRMLARLRTGRLDAATAGILVKAADRLYQRFPEHAPAVASLLRHPDPAVRRAAATTNYLPSHDAYADALAASLSDSELSEKALIALTPRGDPRCVPPLQQLIRHGTLDLQLQHRFRAASALAEHLWPQVRARLTASPSAVEARALLSWTKKWPDGQQAVPEVTAILKGLAPRLDVPAPDSNELETAAACCVFLRRWGLTDEQALSVLRQVASGPDPETGLAAVRALMGLGEPADEEVVGLLLNILERRHQFGRKAGRHGWRFDVNACDRLGELGHRARAAVPALRDLRDAPAEPARAAAAFALWNTTRDADEALPVLIEQIPDDPVRALYDLSLMGDAARPALPILRDYAAGEGDMADRARQALIRIDKAD
ncbi:hypothetical protein BKA00_006619 [Actinomadura coerulea]|uniref:HEAT repeat domain-containing protein n=1 Tax=Actinomadura coerulea TaxID=46159 RepID=A0A7X0L2L5_9ACTN|nr:hypothetical protein [Actinomadura coerulea]MBB6399705.1 hypothetical protein [Actinomadura coerulea]GGQ11824.1 hypothetical protein GCM10010187_29940 [Actinomadura coerulea]